MPIRPEDRATVCVHYIGFRGDEFARARKLFGGPAFIHRRWDARARRDIGPDDVVVFAQGDEAQPLAKSNSADIDERWLPYDPRRTD